ncbi:HAD family hydrolase [Marinicellulosiphila megalodicopiae]|uniref:HAD family hydrolase n=1 Tax=Marinicellulosiphila megalodicopiae TaxID=2724896 RepID=UPI003BB0ACC6
MINCIIFDCDGTLVDSELLCNLALVILLKNYGVNASAELFLDKFRGGKLSKILKIIEHEYDIKLNENFVADYRLLVEELFEKQLTACDGVVDLLYALKIPICVASSGPMQKIKKALSITGLSQFFNNNIFSSYDVGSWKPEPGIFLHAAKKMNVEPENCLVIEDSLLGVNAAIDANMTAVLYDPNGVHHSKMHLKVINHMSELKNIIQLLNS